MSALVLSDVLARLQALCKVKSQSAVAADLGVSLSHLNDVLHCRRGPGPAILNSLGLRKVVSYAPVDVRKKIE